MQQALDHPVLEEKVWPLGWDTWRPDVLILDIIMLAMHLVAIFLFTAHVVLNKADPSFFPLLYLALLILTCFYRLNTQVLIYDNMLVNKKNIRNSYYKWHLVPDVAVMLLCLLEYFRVETDVYRLVVFLKIIDVKNIHDKLKILIRYNHTMLILWRLLGLFVINVTVAHIIALITIGMVNEEVTPNWMSIAGLSRQDKIWTTPYIWAFYWGTTIMLTIGFGDITPRNPK